MFAALLLALGLPLLAVAAPAGATSQSAPACAQFVRGDPSYNNTVFPDGTAAMFVNVFLQAPSCKGVTYTATAYDPATGQVFTAGRRGDGTNPLVLAVVVTNAAGSICGTASTFKGAGDDAGSVALDLIPQPAIAPCTIGGPLSLNGGSGAGGWRS
jgi:hypothetical protein